MYIGQIVYYYGYAIWLLHMAIHMAIYMDMSYDYSVLPIGQKILTLSRILTKCLKWSENGQKIRTKSDNAVEDS